MNRLSTIFATEDLELLDNKKMSTITGGSWIGTAVGDFLASLGNGMDGVNRKHTTIQGYIPGISRKH